MELQDLEFAHLCLSISSLFLHMSVLERAMHILGHCMLEVCDLLFYFTGGLQLRDCLESLKRFRFLHLETMLSLKDYDNF